MKISNNKLHEYECSIKLVKYKKSSEYEGHINLIPNVVGSGRTYKECIDELYENLEIYLDFCKKNKITYLEPNNKIFDLSGRITVRLPKSLHYALNDYAKRDGMSLNTIIIDATREYITKKQ